MTYPQNFEDKIGFSRIRELLAERCLCSLGTQRVAEMRLTDSYDEISRQISETDEMMRILATADFPDTHFYDTRTALKRIRIDNTFLETDELLQLGRSLETISLIVDYLLRTESDVYLYPRLAKKSEHVATFSPIVKKIQRIIDDYGNVKDSASSELAHIRRDIQQATNRISGLLNHILKNAQNEGFIEKNATPTLRDGRLVIPVAPALKRKIGGIVHDESDSGRTVYIEPTEVVEANNHIRELENEERKEIIRILREISAEIRPSADDMLNSYEYLADIDFIRAKALFSQRINAIKPRLVNKPLLDWSQAVHPLLYLSFDKKGQKVVPLEIELKQPNQRILLISGPNAGGKSVCLKTVGLLQYMLQCGLPIPVSEGSQCGVFKHIFIDIGDEQSIEDDLSTYSSHLMNMKFMLRQCDATTLLLIDEFGGGTEPNIGGAIAEALLKRFNYKHAFGVITTHYQNLKQLASQTDGIVNGAMLYDRQEMCPLFQLRIGNPGSSFAVEIARKIGIPEDVIQDASDIVGRDYINADKYLQDIVRDKRYWENKRQAIHQHEKKMEQTIERYEADIQRLQAEKKEILAHAKEQAQQLLAESNARIEQTIREIKEAQAEKERTKDIRQDFADFKQSVRNLDTEAMEEHVRRQMEKSRHASSVARTRKKNLKKVQMSANQSRRKWSLPKACMSA